MDFDPFLMQFPCDIYFLIGIWSEFIILSILDRLDFAKQIYSSVQRSINVVAPIVIIAPSFKTTRSLSPKISFI